MKTIIKATSIFFMIFSCLNAFAQYQRTWIETYKGYMLNSINQAYAIAVDNDGNSYVTGYSSIDLTTIKYNASGVQQWESRYNGGGWGSLPNIGYSIVTAQSIDGNQYVYVTGAVRNNNGNYVYITLKLSSADGSLVWLNPPKYDGGFGDNTGKQIVVDVDGNCYVTGSSMGNGTGYDWVTIAYSASGRQLWLQRFNNRNVNGDDCAASLFCAGGPTIYVTGTTQLGYENYCIETIAYNGLNGNILWTANPYPGHFQDVSSLENKVIAADNSHGVYVTGTGDGNFATVIKYNPADGSLLWSRSDFYGDGMSLGIFSRRVSGDTWLHTNDIFVTGLLWNGNEFFGIAKYSDDGVLQWERGYHTPPFLDLGEYGKSICIDPWENVCATGVVYDNNRTARYGTVAFTKDGNPVFDDFWSGGSNYSDIAHDVGSDQNHNFIMTGESPVGDQGAENYVTIKYSPTSCCSPALVKSGGNNIPKEFKLYQNYPNPFNPATEIKFDIPKNGNVLLKVYDILGKEVSTLIDEFKTAGYYTVKFDGSKLSSGTYFYKIIANDFTDVKKMVMVK